MSLQGLHTRAPGAVTQSTPACSFFMLVPITVGHRFIVEQHREGSVVECFWPALLPKKTLTCTKNNTAHSVLYMSAITCVTVYLESTPYTNRLLLDSWRTLSC